MIEEEEKEEYQYLNLVKKIIDKGVERDDRTGVGTLSLFGETMRLLSSSLLLLIVINE
jgi:thymidylate synthase